MESYYRRLLELSLRPAPAEGEIVSLIIQDLRSRSFEELLAFQTRQSKIRAATQTVRTAQELGVRISADFMGLYLDLQKEVEADLAKNPLVVVSNMWRGLFTPSTGKEDKK